MQCQIRCLALILPVLFLAIGSDTTTQIERQKKSLATDDGLEGRHSDDDGPECPFPFVDVNDMCLYGFCSQTNPPTYLQAAATCKTYGLGSNLAIFNSGNEYNNILSYLKQIDPNGDCNYWVGGTNLNQNVWTWYTGALTPMGIPFWGSGYPSNPSTYHYTILSANLFWGMVNVNEDSSPLSKFPAPLCQYKRPKRRHHHSKPVRSPGFLIPVFPFIPYFPYPHHKKDDY